MVRIIVLRLGHRYVRDYRVTTHLALVARVFGAEKMIVTKIEEDIKKSIEEVENNWGGKFDIEEVENWRNIIKGWKDKNNLIIHLTMYGININTIIDKIRNEGKDIMIIVGAEKVPREVFELSDYNIAIGNQPHSEIAALAIFLDRLFEGKELEKNFNGRLRIIPHERGKIVKRSDLVDNNY